MYVAKVRRSYAFEAQTRHPYRWRVTDSSFCISFEFSVDLLFSNPESIFAGISNKEKEGGGFGALFSIGEFW